MVYLFSGNTTKVQQLSDFLERNIISGVYEEGGNLPSINQLSQTHNVSRDTVFKAFALLREKGLIDSTPGSGYYVTNKRKKVLLVLDEYSPFKTTLYNSFTKNLPSSFQVDLWFHQYNQRFFNRILREAIGKYNFYVVMNFDNERMSPLLNKIPLNKLLLLDFGNFEKEDFSYICQDFDFGFRKVLDQLKESYINYKENIFYFPKESKHPKISCDSFLAFCEDNNLKGRIVEDNSVVDVQKGCSYLVIRQSDVVDIIKNSRKKGLICGKDFGLVAYNDTPAYEVIDNGITAITIDWDKMGKMAAQFITNGKKIQLYIPTEIHLRHSL